MKRLKIKLDEQTHTYHLADGRIADTSITTLIGWFNEVFNPDKVLNKKSKYDNQWSNPVLRAREKREWRDSASWGTYLHELAEQYLLGNLKQEHYDEYDLEVEPQLALVIDYLKTINWDEWDVKPEYETYYETPSGKIIGNTIDVLLVHKTKKNHFAIRDFKFTKSLDDKDYGKKMLFSLDKVPASKLNKYSIQLEVNKRSILQEYPNATFEDNGILLHSPQDLNFKAIPANNVDIAVDNLLDFYDKNDILELINNNNNKKDICQNKKTLKI